MHRYARLHDPKEKMALRPLPPVIVYKRLPLAPLIPSRLVVKLSLHARGRSVPGSITTKTFAGRLVQSKIELQGQ